MQAGEFKRPLQVFAGIVIIVLIGAVALPFVTGTAAPAADNLASQQTDQSSVRVADYANRSTETGTIELDQTPQSKTILIDRAHGNQLDDKKLSTMVNALVKAGHEVQIASQSQARGSAWNESLRGADALVVVNPTETYTQAQLAGVREFADGGGRVLLLADPPSVSTGGIFGFATREQSTQSTALSSALGVSAQSGYLFNMNEYENNFKRIYANGVSGPLADGIDRVVLRDAVSVQSASGQTALRTSEDTRRESTRRQDAFSVAVTTRNVAFIGDSDFLAPQSVYTADNEVLVGNTLSFLITGKKRPNVPSEPEPESERGAPVPSGPSGPSTPSGETITPLPR